MKPLKRLTGVLMTGMLAVALPTAATRATDDAAVEKQVLPTNEPSETGAVVEKVTDVPEPFTLPLLAIGGALLMCRRRR